MRWNVCAMITLCAAGAALGQWAAEGQPARGGGRPGADSQISDIRSYVQRQQQQADGLTIDGKPVSLRSSGASLQVYFGDEPYPESRMKTEGARILLLGADGKPAGQLLMQGQRVVLMPIGDGQQAEGRLLIGVSLSPIDSTLAGHLNIDPDKASLISSVTDGWPASRAGLASGDVIVSVEEAADGTAQALRSAIAERKAGDELALGVISGGERRSVTLTLSDEARESTVAWPYLNQAQLLQPGAGGEAASAYTRGLIESRQQEQLRAETLNRLALSTGRATDEARRAAELAQVEARRFSERMALTDGARVTVDIPAGGGSAVVSPGPQGDISRRLSALEERMARIEAMLRQLTEQGGGR